MTIDEYYELAMRTKNRSGVSSLPDLAVDALGLAGEAGELLDILRSIDCGNRDGHTLDDIKKEAGDVLWYIASACHTLGLSLSEIADSLWFDWDYCPEPTPVFGTGSAVGNATGLTVSCCKIADVVKKNLGHGRSLDIREVEDILGDCVLQVYEVAHDFCMSMEIVAEANIEKLRKRYPNGFNTADSIAKADEVPVFDLHGTEGRMVPNAPGLPLYNAEQDDTKGDDQ